MQIMKTTNGPTGDHVVAAPPASGGGDGKGGSGGGGGSSSAARALPFAPNMPTEASMEPQRKPAPPTKVSSDGIVLRIGVGELIKVIGTILLVAASFWALKSDLRDIKTNQDWQTKTSEDRWRTQEERMGGLDRKWQLQQYDINDIKLALARAGLYQGEIRITTPPQPQQPTPNGAPK